MTKKKKLKKAKKRIKRKTKVKIASIPPTKPNFYKSKILRTNELKIKKIVKQPTEKKNYKVKDYVVYPKHGVGKIISIERTKIGNIDIHFYKVFIKKEKLTLSIPLNQQSHLRYVSSINQINKAITIKYEIFLGLPSLNFPNLSFAFLIVSSKSLFEEPPPQGLFPPPDPQGLLLLSFQFMKLFLLILI